MAAARRGRPRDPRIDRAILAAARDLFTTKGYSGLTIEAVAAAASVDKTAIYRRYGNKAELVTASFLATLSIGEIPPGTATTRARLAEFVHRMHQTLAADSGFAAVGALQADERPRPELLRKYRTHVFEASSRVASAILADAVEREEVRADADVDVTIDLLMGAVWARHLRGLPETDEWIESVVDTVLEGLSRR